jgi:hypothetical protein
VVPRSRSSNAILDPARNLKFFERESPLGSHKLLQLSSFLSERHPTAQPDYIRRWMQL